MFRSNIPYRFLILSLALVAMACWWSVNGHWAGDFWEHSAAVKELAAHLWQPRHPLLLLDAPHPFYSPYSLLVALAARYAGCGSINALAVAGVVNLCLWLIGLRLLVYALACPRPAATLFYLLLLILFWWGDKPWDFSGFFHISAIFSDLPYPSTWAAALSFAALAVTRKWQETARKPLLLLLLLLITLVLLSHPLTFIFLAFGLVGMSGGARGRVLAQLAIVGSLLVLAVGLAACWPYYSLLALTQFSSPGYVAGNNANNFEMYKRVVNRMWPALVFGIPLLLAKARANWRQPLVLITALAAASYVCGAFSGAYSQGRIITYVVLLLQFTLAERLAAAESQSAAENAASHWRSLVFAALIMGMPLLVAALPLRWRSRLVLLAVVLGCARALFGGRFAVSARARVAAALESFTGKLPAGQAAFLTATSPRILLPLSVIAACAYLSFAPFQTVLDRARAGRTYAEFLFLPRVVGQDEVVLSDLETSLIIPSFAGKVVMVNRPEAFVPDQAERKQAAATFFQPETDDATRQRIIAQYGARYLLWQKSGSADKPKSPPWLTPPGRAVYENEDFQLFALDVSDK